jgi:hypothetical protein
MVGSKPKIWDQESSLKTVEYISYYMCVSVNYKWSEVFAFYIIEIERNKKQISILLTCYRGNTKAIK